MNILAIADPHGSESAFKRIKDKAKKADIILVAGDMTIFGTDTKKICRKMNSWGKPTLIIPGNHEDPQELKNASKNLKNLIYTNGKSYEKENIYILSIEGNGFSYIDKRFDKVANRFIPAIKRKKEAAKKAGKPFHFILMTHAPPYKTKLDELTGGKHCGNKSVRNFIKKMQPDLAITGHIHECFEKEDKIKKTLIVNPGVYGRMFSF